MSWEEHSEKLRSLWEVFLVFTSGIFLLLCFGTPYWEIDLSKYDASGVKLHAGLWTCCIEEGTIETCRHSDCNIPGKFSLVSCHHDFYNYCLHRSRDCNPSVDVFGFCVWVVCMHDCHGILVKVET